MKKLVFVLALSLISTLGFASGDGHDHGNEDVKMSSTINKTSMAITEAGTTFMKEFNQEEINLFQGFKAWPSNGGITVKVLLKNRANIKYECHQHHEGENVPFECHYAE